MNNIQEELKNAIKVASAQEHKAIPCTQEWLEFVLEGVESQAKEIERLRNMAEIVLYHHPNVDDPIDYESAYDNLKKQIEIKYEGNPWISSIQSLSEGSDTP